MTIGTDEEMIGRPIESRLKFKKNKKRSRIHPQKKSVHNTTDQVSGFPRCRIAINMETLLELFKNQLMIAS